MSRRVSTFPCFIYKSRRDSQTLPMLALTSVPNKNVFHIGAGRVENHFLAFYRYSKETSIYQEKYAKFITVYISNAKKTNLKGHMPHKLQ